MISSSRNCIDVEKVNSYSTEGSKQETIVLQTTQPGSQGFFLKKMGRAGKGPGIGRSTFFSDWLVAMLQLMLLLCERCEIEFRTQMGASKEATPTKIFLRHPVCMLYSESKDSHTNLLHPQFLGVFLREITELLTVST